MNLESTHPKMAAANPQGVEVIDILIFFENLESEFFSFFEISIMK
jgi:hypothetical protein